MPEIPLKFRTHLPDENSIFQSVELEARIDIFASLKCQEHLFSAEMEENMKKSIARYLDNKFFSRLRNSINASRQEIMNLHYLSYQDASKAVEVFNKIESAIPQITTNA